MPMSLGLGLGLPHVGGNPFAAYTANGYAPEVVLDWSQNKAKGVQFSELVHTRASNATQVASDGTVQWAPHNLLTYSEDFSNAAWPKHQASITANDAIAPDGTTTADKLTGTGNIEQNVKSTQTYVAGETVTCRVWAKAAELDSVDLLASTPLSTTNRISVDLTDGSVSVVSGSAFTYSTTDAGNGWWLISWSYTVVNGGTTANGYWIDLRQTTYTADHGVHLWGAHLYRSDLSGMANNPARNDTYVPTTSAAVYLPRVENHIYSGGEWVKRGLIEPAATNLFTYSAQFDNAAWSKVRSSVSADATTAPDGTATADKLVANTDNNSHFITQGAVASDDYAPSIFAKAGEYDFLKLTVADGGFPSVWFNLSNGTVGTEGAGLTGSIEHFGNGWYRCSVVNDTAITQAYFEVSNADGSGSFTGDGSSGIYIWGAQIENNLAVSSYIPTSGSTATRAADTYHIPAATITAALGGSMPSAVSIALDGEMSYGDTADTREARFARWGNEGPDGIMQYLATDGARTGDPIFRQWESGVSDIIENQATNYTPGVNVPLSIASAHSASRINGAVDGAALTENTTVTALADLTSADFEIAPTGVINLERLLIWAVDVGDTGLEETSA